MRNLFALKRQLVDVALGTLGNTSIRMARSIKPSASNTRAMERVNDGGCFAEKSKRCSMPQRGMISSLCSRWSSILA
jgi:hypothetical protein